jgi:hypothetical protein
LIVLAMAGVSLAFASTAVASASSFMWTGGAATPNWSAAENWEGGTAPIDPPPVALEFPRLPACIATCYDTRNDMSGLPVESLSVDDGDKYKLEGEQIALGAGGLTAFPASGSSGSAGDVFGLPIALDAEQIWSISGSDDLAANGVFIDGGLTGPPSSPLTLKIGGEPVVYLASDADVGPVTIDGADPSKAGVFNGVVNLRGFQLNSQDNNSVSLNHIFFFGNGTLGPLRTEAAELGVGIDSYPSGSIEASSATFDSASEVHFWIAGAGAAPGEDNSQLSADGQIQLGGASLFVSLGPPSAGAPCPSLAPGRTYTLISTTGALSGSFGNALENSEIPIEFAEACGEHEAQNLRIEYHESGTTQTVTATVKVAGGLPAPEKHYNEYEKPNAEGAIYDLISSAQAVAEAKAREQKAREETEDRMRAATAAKALTDEVSLAGTSITVQSDGVALVKLDCVGNGSCAGKLTLSATSTTKEKKKSHTITIGTDEFLLASGKMTTAHIKLDTAGRKLLADAHQHLAARLEIQKLTPAPVHMFITSIHLTRQKAYSMR